MTLEQVIILVHAFAAEGLISSELATKYCDSIEDAEESIDFATYKTREDVLQDVIIFIDNFN